MKVNLPLENKIICEKERLFVNTKSVLKPYFTFPFFANIELSPHFLIWCYQFLSVRPNQKLSRVIYLEFKTCFILYDDEISFFENLIFSNAPITADDYLVEGMILCGLRCNPSCFYRSTNNGLSFGSPFFVTQLEISETLLTQRKPICI